MASRLSLSQPRLMEVLKATAFRGCKDDNQLAALIIVANQYELNPLTKEIYAFPGRDGEIVPIVSIDGWLRIINTHPQFDGMDEEFAPDGSWCKVTIYRKDRSRPTVHTEFLEECRRNTEPWKQHTRRMLKWKAIIQGGRIAFGYSGIYDEDEGRDVAMRDVTPQKEPGAAPGANPFRKAPQALPDPEPEPEPEASQEEAVDFQLDGNSNMVRGYFESVTQQESKPGVKKPWKLWRLKYQVNGECKEAVTFSETFGGELDWMKDGDEFLVEVEDTGKGDVIKEFRRVDA